MAGKSVIMINFLFLWFTYGLAEEPPIAKPGNCKAQCGDVRVPYPFGMDSSHCYMDDWFEIVCNRTGAFLKKINMEVLEITITSGNEPETTQFVSQIQ